LKRKFEDIAEKFGIKIAVDIDHTLEPGGNGIGPALEAVDVLKILEQKKDRPLNLEARSLRLAGLLLDLCYKTDGKKIDGTKKAKEILQSGKALDKFKEIIEAQQGTPDITSDKVKMAKHKKDFLSNKSGRIMGINNYNLNSVAKILGAPNDKKAGIFLHARNGTEVKNKQPLMSLFASNQDNISEAEETIKTIPIFEVK